MKVLELKIPPIIIMALIGVIMWFVATLVPQLVLVIPGQFILAAIAGFTSIALILAGAIAFRLAGTTVNPMQPSNTSSIVTRGIYKISRNPMYAGFLLLLLSWALLLSNIVSFAGLPVFVWYMNRFQIIPEEQALIAKFGAEYIAYAKNVRRWL
ncbi:MULTISPECIES: methyltransferase family protein [Nitrosomonas]|uniref:Protein-S-isoprenylcysteine O-methyltransferase Ste14 n=1 Tax=Nitrosomonas communis TaxID=44574 RepID=A0A0F7KFS0_9PROT|nr:MULTISPECIES: isoprenylcysteine carboxylmethyltransferase family protein [Nitrosomonas]AKH39295.1 protein-S-isoprenylcysteine methyltransferase [Nitrosomonas communis]TYP90867.1 protein-S-isoprenylcysteine O-methyltransferase Ste14 [Nitrosomonas communis]UVS61519.1 isoprenylcysteine carboxylmethyltransferase family protein [Nitrosomonas sp. PLL12]